VGKGIQIVVKRRPRASAATGNKAAALWCCLICRAMALCGTKKHFRCLDFLLLFHQEKSNRRYSNHAITKTKRKYIIT
jgi:hypothetical protein